MFSLLHIIAVAHQCPQCTYWAGDNVGE